ncbi:unnamed protein product [Clonostachys chloroleuca]|uniref:Uncharacterized protein n=1 Tax=Clonostachys chloroleuca TaxID=1926264 RepID=A0AA35PX36_9HYPO|nr:unnamed protein product [Clonostachys chloroleuca]
MRFFIPIIAGAIGVAAFNKAGIRYANDVHARSAKELLHHVVRSLDEEDARDLLARYNYILEERDEYLVHHNTRANKVFSVRWRIAVRTSLSKEVVKERVGL